MFLSKETIISFPWQIVTNFNLIFFFQNWSWNFEMFSTVHLSSKFNSVFHFWIVFSKDEISIPNGIFISESRYNFEKIFPNLNLNAKQQLSWSILGGKMSKIWIIFTSDYLASNLHLSVLRSGSESLLEKYSMKISRTI